MNKLKQFFLKAPSWWIFVTLLIIGGVVVWLSPAEATLGNGIKPVYIHVPLTIVAKVLLYSAAGIGILGLIWPDRLIRWSWLIYRVALGMFLVGFLFSGLASVINWGNIPFQEPRFLKSANVSVVGVAIWLIWHLIPWVRLKNVLLAFPPMFFITWSAPTTWVLHPDTAMRTAPGGIRTTFIIMFSWASIVALWWLWHLYAAQPDDEQK